MPCSSGTYPHPDGTTGEMTTAMDLLDHAEEDPAPGEWIYPDPDLSSKCDVNSMNLECIARIAGQFLQVSLLI